MMLQVDPSQKNRYIPNCKGIISRYNWTTKVTDVLGQGYEFIDDYRTRELTMKDLLSHRTGLATLDEGLMSGYPRSLSREALCK